MNFSLLELCIFFSLLFSTNNNAFSQANDNCVNAVTIYTDSTCVTGTSKMINQTLAGATSDGYTINSTCGYSGTAKDIWYKFKIMTFKTR